MKTFWLFLVLFVFSLCSGRSAIWFEITNAVANYPGGTWTWAVSNYFGVTISTSTYPAVTNGGGGVAWIGLGDAGSFNHWSWVSNAPPWLTKFNLVGWNGQDNNQVVTYYDKHVYQLVPLRVKISVPYQPPIFQVRKFKNKERFQ